MHESVNAAPSDFDCIIGQWIVRHRRLNARLCNCTEWSEFDGRTTTRTMLGGFGNVEDNVLGFPEGRAFQQKGVRADETLAVENRTARCFTPSKDCPVTLLLNLLWFVLGGFAAGLLWLMCGVLLACTIIGIPFAVAAFRIAGFAAWPFGRTLVNVEQPILGTGIANVLWFLLAGVWLWLAHVFVGIGCCVTIIGIPFGFAHFRLAAVSVAPLGKRVQQV